MLQAASESRRPAAAWRRPASIASEDALDAYLARRGARRRRGAPAVIRSGRNIVAEVSLEGGRDVVLKQGRTRGSADEGALLNEGRFHLCAESRRLGEREGYLARCRYHDREADILIFDKIAGTESLGDRVERSGELSPRTSRTIGAAIGAVHAATSDGARDVTTLGADIGSLVPQVLEVGPEDLAGLSAGEIELVRLVQGDPSLAEALAALAEGWRRQCLVHGDLRADNVLVPRGREEPAVLIDWELTRYGDPACDLGSLIGDVVRSCLDRVRPSEGAVREWTRPAAGMLARLSPALSSLWEGYRSTAQRLADPRPSLPVLAVAHAGVFLLHRTAAGAQGLGGLGPREYVYAGMARRLVLDPASCLHVLLKPGAGGAA